jgi:hypothetical protein
LAVSAHGGSWLYIISSQSASSRREREEREKWNNGFLNEPRQFKGDDMRINGREVQGKRQG